MTNVQSSWYPGIWTKLGLMPSDFYSSTPLYTFEFSLLSWITTSSEPECSTPTADDNLRSAVSWANNIVPGTSPASFLRVLRFSLWDQERGEQTANHEESEDLHDMVEPRR